MRKTAGPILSRCRTNLVYSYLLFSVVAMVGCVAAPPPYDDYAIAKAAIRAAQDADSARFSTGLWNKAEENYRSGQKAYRESDFESAKKLFQLAIVYAEKAENATRLKKFQTGDSFP
jgi:hypothetical protein